MSEQILAIRRYHLPKPRASLITGEEITSAMTAILKHGEIVDRDGVETCYLYKQVIPYIVVINRNTHMPFAYSRTRAGTDKRLHETRSIGVGGHVGTEDGGTNARILHNGALREVAEEFSFDGLDMSNGVVIGIINSDETEVDRYHVGIVIAVLADNKYTCNDTVKHSNYGWVTFKEAARDKLMESWSKIILV